MQSPGNSANHNQRQPDSNPSSHECSVTLGMLLKPRFPVVSDGMIKILFGELVGGFELKEVKNPA